MPRLCVIPGDGIGKEVVPAAVEVLQAVLPDLETDYAEAGWECFQKYGKSVPDETLEKIKDCKAGLFGAVSSPSKKVEGYRSAILTIRQTLDLYANIRPVQTWPNVSPRDDVNLIIVRENTEGLYVGRERKTKAGAVAERVVTVKASFRIVTKALNLALMNDIRKLTIVHKANVLPLTDGLFREQAYLALESFTQNGHHFEMDELLVDVAALKILAEPDRFELIVTTNLFGDILSDAASYWGGGLGMSPSLNWGDEIGVAEPVHGSAPDIAGQGLANPIATILSAALLTRYVWRLPEIAERIKNAVRNFLTETDLSAIHKDVTNHISQGVINQIHQL